MGDAYRNENEAAFAAVEGLRQENEQLRHELASVEKRLRAVEERGANTLQLPSSRSRARQVWVACVGAVVACGVIGAIAALRVRQPESAGPLVVQGPVVFKAATAREPPEPSPELDPPFTTRPTIRDPPLGDHGLLSVICIPGCDAVYDNGTLLGPSPVFKRPASLGSHEIKLVLTNPPATKTMSTVVVADQVSMVRESMP